MNKKTIVIEKVEELHDANAAEVIGRLVTDKSGEQFKIKSGQGGRLKEKWSTLDSGVGKAFTLTMGEFKGYPFVQDFEETKDVFEAEAAKKVANQHTEFSPQETGMWYKEIGEMIRTGFLKDTIPVHYALKAAYFIRMKLVIGITVEEKKEV